MLSRDATSCAVDAGPPPRRRRGQDRGALAGPTHGRPARRAFCARGPASDRSGTHDGMSCPASCAPSIRAVRHSAMRGHDSAHGGHDANRSPFARGAGRAERARPRHPAVQPGLRVGGACWSPSTVATIAGRAVRRPPDRRGATGGVGTAARQRRSGPFRRTTGRGTCAAGCASSREETRARSSRARWPRRARTCLSSRRGAPGAPRTWRSAARPTTRWRPACRDRQRRRG